MEKISEERIWLESLQNNKEKNDKALMLLDCINLGIIYQEQGKIDKASLSRD